MDDYYVRQPEALEWQPEDYFTPARYADFFSHPSRSVEVELGCGEGSFIVQMAEKYPKQNFLAVERLLGRVRKVSNEGVKRGLDNLKLLRLENHYTLEHLLPRESVSRVHLLFPDPWPKKRHHKRRLVTEEFLRSVYDCLKREGEFLFKTDDLDYFEWTEEKVSLCSDLFVPAKWSDATVGFYPLTDFECHWLEKGKTIYCLRCVKAK